jgi:ACS family glucarate transporter-like MFS transporter
MPNQESDASNHDSAILTRPVRAPVIAGRWALVVLLFLTASASYLCRVNISVVGALMMRDLGFSQIDMGRLFSAFVLSYALFQIPSGTIADRWGARRVLGWAAFWWAVVTVSMAILGWIPIGGKAAGAFVILVLLRFVLGVGEAPTFPAAAQGVAQWIPPPQQGLANGIVIAGIGAGSAIAPTLLSKVMIRWGWQIALMVSAIPAMAVALAWMGLTGSGQASSRPTTESLRKSAGRVLGSRSFVLLTLSYTLQGYVGYIFVFWFYLYLVDVRHFDLRHAGNLSSLPWLLSVISIPLGGLISDRLIKGPFGLRWGRRAIPMFGLTFSGICLVLGAATVSANSAVVYLTLATALVLCVEGPFWATMMELAGPRSGTAGGIMNFGSNIGGMISPTLTPILAAHVGWKNALYVAAAISLLSAGLWLGISPHDPDRQTTSREATP